MAHKRLGELLIEKRIITKTQLAHALERQQKYGGRIGINLVMAGVINESDLMRFLAAQTGVKEINLDKVKLKPKIVKKLPQKIAMKYVILPLGMKDRSTLVVACVDPTDLSALDEVSFVTGHRVIPVIAPHSKILHKLKEIYAAVPLADNAPVRGSGEDEVSGNTPGGGHAALTDPDLIIFGEQTLDGVEPIQVSPDSARPLGEPESMAKTVSVPVPEPDEDEFTLDFSPISMPLAQAESAPATGQFTMDQRMLALYHLLIKKKIVTEAEIEKELMRLWSLGKL